MMAVPAWQAQQQAKQAAAQKARAEALAFLHNKGEAVSETSKYSVFKGKATDEGIREKAPADNTLQLVAARRAQEKAAAAIEVPTAIPKVSLASAAVHTNSTAKPKEDLPPGWTAVKDPASGKSYYYNAMTGKTQWDLPKAPKQKEGEAAAADTASAETTDTGGGEKKELPAALKIKLQARGILKGTAEPAKPVLLPLGWYPATTPEGKTYYYTADGRRQWKVPTEPAAASAPQTAPATAAVPTQVAAVPTTSNEGVSTAQESRADDGEEKEDTTVNPTTAQPASTASATTADAAPQQTYGVPAAMSPGFPPGIMMMPPNGPPDAAMQAYYYQYMQSMMMMQAMASGQMPMTGMPPKAAQQPQTAASGPLLTNESEPPKKQWDNKARYFKRSKGPESSAMDPLDPTGTGGRWSDGLEVPNIKKKPAEGDASAAAVRPSGGPLPSPGEILRMNAAAAAGGTAGQKRPAGASGGEESGEERGHAPKRPRGPG